MWPRHLEHSNQQDITGIFGTERILLDCHGPSNPMHSLHIKETRSSIIKTINLNSEIWRILKKETNFR